MGVPVRVYRIIAVATAVSFVLAVPGSIGAQTLPIRQLDTNKIEKKAERVVSAKQQQQLRILSRSISRTQVLTWKCQDTLGIGRTKASASPWALPASIP